jgi:FkbH-like protein
MSDILTKIKRRLDRDRGLPIAKRLSKTVEYVSARGLAPLFLRECNHVGSRVRTIGRPRIANSGWIEIGSDSVLNSTFAPCELLTGPAGRIEIGSSVGINFGTAISASLRVKIGDGVRIGPYSILEDSEIGERADDAGVAEIEIGEGAWLATRVTVLPGTRIGARAVITAGSVVSGEIPPDVVAGGNPARVLRPTRHDSHSANDAVTNSADHSEASISVRATVASQPGADTNAPASALEKTTGEAERAPSVRAVILADFTTGELAGRLGAADDDPVVQVVAAPFDQVTQWLLSGERAESTDVAVVWTSPERVSEAFQRILRHEDASAADLERDVDGFTEHLRLASARYRTVFVPTWTSQPEERGLGMIDARPGGITWALAVMNRRLMEGLASSSSIFVLNAQRWIDGAARPSAGGTGWYVGKARYRGEVMAEAAKDIKASLRGLAGQARKLLIVDLDDTLWGGIVGDVGWQNLQLGGHDPIGEAFVDFQRLVKRVKRRGILLGIVSKNTESVALEAMGSHPEMVLRPDDFVGWRINWNDKAQNIADLTAELRLGLQSVVFIDDNPVERARVREALPEVLVPEWPQDKVAYPRAFSVLRCFDAPALSREDADRTRLYSDEQRREALRQEVGSVDAWLASLDIQVHAEPLRSDNIARTTQLLNKTNQMNLSTRRLNETELRSWADSDDRALWTITVSDRFGDAGLTGIVSVERGRDACHLIDFVLSCRVMGRKVEETMTHLAVAWARRSGARRLEVSYKPTAKNKPCHDYWLQSDFEANDTRTHFTWDTDDVYPVPSCVTLREDE